MKDKTTPKTYEFTISIMRTGYAHRDTKIIASDFEQAKKIALDTAGDYEYIEHSSEYEVVSAERSIEPLEIVK
jgi:hypothetical protein